MKIKSKDWLYYAMLFLLRKIRRSLLQQNKFTSYLLYGIGEVILVVVGILIAVQIDDLNEAGKLKAKEAKYYCKLLEDVNQDVFELERLLQETEERISHSNRLLSLLQQENPDPGEVINEMMGSISLVTFTFKPSSAAFEDLKSSGNLSLIDEQVAKKLREYYVTIDGIIDVVDINSDQAVELFQETESYAKIGWVLIDFVDEAIDSTLVNKEKLRALIIQDKAYKDELVSDAIYFVGAISRVKMLYLKLQTNITEMQLMLAGKCEEKQ